MGPSKNKKMVAVSFDGELRCGLKGLSQLRREKGADRRIILAPENESLTEDRRVRKIDVFSPRDFIAQSEQDRFGKQNERWKMKEGRLHPANGLSNGLAAPAVANRVLVIEKHEPKFRRLRRFQNIGNFIAVTQPREVTTDRQTGIRFDRLPPVSESKRTGKRRDFFGANFVEITTNRDDRQSSAEDCRVDDPSITRRSGPHRKMAGGEGGLDRKSVV